MPTPAPTTDVVVLGGGVLGVSTACHLARAGVAVTLVTEGPLTSGASGRSLAWLNSAAVRSEPYHRLRLAGIDRYRTLASRLGPVGWLRFTGSLTWLADPDDLQRDHEHAIAHGYDSRWLSRSEVADLVPGVAPDAVPATGALLRAGEGWVDLPTLSRLLADELVRRGGRVLTGTGPARPVVVGGAVVGVRTSAGERVAADTVVLASGHTVPGLLAELGIAVPDATQLALQVGTARVRTDLASVLNTPGASVRPTPTGGLVVDADWASAQVVSHPNGYAVPPDVVDGLLTAASGVLSGHPPLEVDRVGVGPKPVPGDGEPVLGGLDDVAGLSVAFTHSGATLALIVGELLADEITSGRAHPMLAPFHARRFPARQLEARQLEARQLEARSSPPDRPGCL